MDEKNTNPGEEKRLDVDLNTGEIIPEEKKKDYKAPEATKAGSLEDVSRAASGDTGDGVVGIP